MNTKLTIVDDHTVLRNGLELLLHNQPGIEVVGSFGTAKALIASLQQGLHTDVLLLDLQLPDMSGMDVLKKITPAYPSIKTIVLTSLDSSLVIRSLLQSGAKGYLLKNSDQDEILKAIQAVQQEEIYLSQEIKEILVKSTLNHKTALRIHEELSERELQILQLIAEEYTSPEIAERIHLSARTVENYRLGLMHKLDVKNIAGLIKKAIFMGLIK